MKICLLYKKYHFENLFQKFDPLILKLLASLQETDKYFIKTLEYEFKTNSKELMEIISGELSVQLQEETNWNNIKEGMSFNVSKDSSFKVKVLKTTNYSCSYLD